MRVCASVPQLYSLLYSHWLCVFSGLWSQALQCFLDWCHHLMFVYLSAFWVLLKDLILATKILFLLCNRWWFYVKLHVGVFFLLGFQWGECVFIDGSNFMSESGQFWVQIWKIVELFLKHILARWCQSVSFWLPCAVCGSQLQTHWFLLKSFTTPHKYIV